MNVAVALAAGRLPGITVALDSVAPATGDAEQLIAAVNDGILGGTMSDNTRRVIRDQLADARDPVAARALAVGRALGGPEVPRQRREETGPDGRRPERGEGGTVSSSPRGV